MNSKEYQSSAEGEGWAHFFAAVAFDSTAETDCGFYYYKSQDYNLSGNLEAGGLHAFDCDVGPATFTTSGIASFDYLGSKCNTPHDDLGTEMDWLRFWWDFVSEESAVEFSTCIDILDRANPNGWDDNGGGSESDDPYNQILSGVAAYDVATPAFLMPILDSHAQDNGVAQ